MKIIFVCHGNICRSPMAEYLFKNMLFKADVHKVDVLSRGTSAEEEGNPCHYGTKQILDSLGIDCSGHVAKKITKEECDGADLIVCMDMYNVWRLQEIGADPDKIKRISEFTNRVRDVEDPWYTHDFKKSFRQIAEGLEGLLKYVKEHK